jgi:hypothetical protein
MDSPLTVLVNAIRAACTPAQYEWLLGAFAELKQCDDVVETLATNLARARRRLGRAVIGNDAAVVTTAAGELPIGDWEAGDAGRVALVLSALENRPADTVALVNDAYRLGSEPEKAALIRGLVLYAADDRLKPLALETGRTNSVDLFRALASRNPYPAAYFDEREFNQLVLKALFIGVNTELTIGLQRRANPELSRMCEDYYDERIAAGRTVPADIWLALGPHASPRGVALMGQALTDSDVAQRIYTGIALARRKAVDATAEPILRKHLQREPDERARRVITQAMADNPTPAEK